MAQEEAIKYGDVFEMSGDLAAMPISPRDAAAMRSAEKSAFGKTVKGGPADLMFSAATKNFHAGFVGPDDSTGAVPPVAATHSPVPSATAGDVTTHNRAADLTIGDALEAAAVAMKDKPVDRKDAAAIAAAELRATSGVSDSFGAAARAAVALNEGGMMLEQDKISVAEIIGDAKGKMAKDKAVEKGDAEWVAAAEVHQVNVGDVSQSTTAGGVADTMAMAADLNKAENP